MRTLLSALIILFASSTVIAEDTMTQAANNTPTPGYGPFLPEGLDRKELTSERVKIAMSFIDRRAFVPEALVTDANDDHALPIGSGQTISQPFIVAYMTQAAGIDKGMKVLEIGTGSGYQAAVLAKLGAQVFTIEIVEALAESAEKRLAALEYENISVRHGDGFLGWESEAPFDAILVTAAAPRVPDRLFAQLILEGKMVIPLIAEDGTEWMTVVTRKKNDIPHLERKFPVRFVPMTGEIQGTVKE